MSRLSILNVNRFRKGFCSFRLHSIFFRSLKNNFFFSKKVFFKYSLFFYNLIFFSRVYHYCLLSYRSRGVLSFFYLTRMMFKYYALSKYFPGIKKVSW